MIPLRPLFLALAMSLTASSLQAQTAAPVDLGNLNSLLSLAAPAATPQFNTGRFITNTNFAQVFSGGDNTTLSQFLLIAIFVQGELNYDLTDPLESYIFLFASLNVYNQLQVPLPLPVLPTLPTTPTLPTGQGGQGGGTTGGQGGQGSGTTGGQGGQGGGNLLPIPTVPVIPTTPTGGNATGGGFGGGTTTGGGFGGGTRGG